MVRKGLILSMLIVCCHGPVLAQGWFDSLFGSGGLGLWNSGVGDQWNNPQFYGGSQMPGAPGGQLYGEQPLHPAMPGTPQQGYMPQGQPVEQVAPSYSQPGIYSDWHANQPAPLGPQAQENYQQQPQQQYAAPQQQYAPQQYAAPPPQQQYAPKAQQPVRPQPRVQRQRAPQSQATSPAQPQAPAYPQYGVPQGVAQLPAVQQGHYAPQQQQIDAENLPAGAVQITTTTPEGTQVQYYPPAGMGVEQAPAMQPQPRRPKPRSAASGPRSPKGPVREQASTGNETEIAPSIPMPRPVEIPSGPDPRVGWGAGIQRPGGAAQPR